VSGLDAFFPLYGSGDVNHHDGQEAAPWLTAAR
jgi:hypothetical protein